MVDFPPWFDVLLLAGLVPLNAWLLWLATRGAQERGDLKKRCDGVARDLADFKVEVAKTYVSTTAFREMDERIFPELRRVNDRLDAVLARLAGGAK